MTNMDARFIGIALSMATVALVIITIAVFIAFGGTALFYVLVFATIAIGFINTWYISTEEQRTANAHIAASQATAPPRRPARRVRKARTTRRRKRRT